LAACLENVDVRSGQLALHRGEHARRVRGSNRDRETQLAFKTGWHVPAKRQAPQLVRMKDALHAGNRARQQDCFGFDLCPLWKGRGEIPGTDALGGGTQHEASRERECSQGDHRVRLLTCWYMSSAAFTTLELAS